MVKVSTETVPHAQNFVAAIRNDDPTICNAEILGSQAHKSTLMGVCHLGNIAHRTGRNLRCDPGNGHILGDDEAMGYWSKEYAKGWEPKVVADPMRSPASRTETVPAPAGIRQGLGTEGATGSM